MKGDWGQCVLSIKCSSSNLSDHDELYSFLTKADLEKKLGADLAQDLIERHNDAEKKLPANKKGKYVQAKLGCKREHHLMAVELEMSMMILFHIFTCWVSSFSLGWLVICNKQVPSQLRNRDFPDREDLKTYKCFMGIEERKRRRFESSAEVRRDATINEDDMFDLMLLSCPLISEVISYTYRISTGFFISCVTC